jgi:hydroxypyruvate reductase
LTASVERVRKAEWIVWLLIMRDGMKDRQLLQAMFAAAVKAADPMTGIRAHLPPPPESGRTVVVGAGKGAAQMAAALEVLWSECHPGSPLDGVVVTRYGYGCPTKSIRILEASHPVPDAAGLAAAKQLVDAVERLSPNDLVIALISGGGSALLPAPPEGLTLEHEIALNEMLLASGAPISAMNVVRKHFSTIKGGRLAASTKARVISLIVSDIPGDNPAFVASGPTIPDKTTRQEALAIVQQYKLDLPQAMISHLSSPAADAPNPEDALFAGHECRVVASAGVSLEAAAEVARAQGLTPYILSDSIEGEARDVALVHAALAREVNLRNRPFSKPCVLLSGGETTVTLRGKGGKGGRNGEFALALALASDGLPIEALAADTDGIDGSEANAGVFVDGTTVLRLRAAGFDAGQLLAGHDSFTGFSAIGDLFETGPTGTNVNDFRAILLR